MKKLGLMALTASALLLTACGGGSGSSEVNAGNNKNDYGYYGGTTKFGDYPATRYWAMFSQGEVMALLLTDKAVYGISDGDQVLSGIYGISGDAQTIKSDKLNDIHILSKSNYTWNVDGQNVNCYNVSGGDRDIVMCPDEAYHGGPIEKNLNNLMLKAYDSKVFSNVASENLK